MLKIDNITGGFQRQDILHGISLDVGESEIHSIMGPNGSGKSTFAKALAGHPDYPVTSGSVALNGKNLLAMEPEERALEGLFIAFQNPVEIPGIKNAEFMRMAYNAKRAHFGLEEADPFDFDQILRDKMELLDITASFADRDVNDGFSGGEKKKNELLQMALLEPMLAVLDEIDSGLDIDAMKLVARGVNRVRDKGASLIVITHYQRLLDYIRPDYVHVLKGGRIIKSGTAELAMELEAQGYEAIFAGALENE